MSLKRSQSILPTQLSTAGAGTVVRRANQSPVAPTAASVTATKQVLQSVADDATSTTETHDYPVGDDTQSEGLSADSMEEEEEHLSRSDLEAIFRQESQNWLSKFGSNLLAIQIKSELHAHPPLPGPVPKRVKK